jgi:hypothetical protein
LTSAANELFTGNRFAADRMKEKDAEILEMQTQLIQFKRIVQEET